MKKIGEYKPDNLVAGEMHRSTAEIILEAGQVYPMGAVIGVKNNGNGTLVDSQASESKKIYGILAHEVDAVNSNVGGIVYLTGEFNQNFLTFGGSDDYNLHKESAREIGLFFVDSEQPHIIE